MVLWGYQKHWKKCRHKIENALEYTRKWRVTTNVKKCDEEKESPVIFSWKWGEEELPIVDQYTYLGVKNDHHPDLGIHTNKVNRKG